MSLQPWKEQRQHLRVHHGIIGPNLNLFKVVTSDEFACSGDFHTATDVKIDESSPGCATVSVLNTDSKCIRWIKYRVREIICRPSCFSVERPGHQGGLCSTRTWEKLFSAGRSKNKFKPVWKPDEEKKFCLDDVSRTSCKNSQTRAKVVGWQSI